MTRSLALLAIALLLCTGCGSALTPSLVGIPGLSSGREASDDASVVVVTARLPGRGLEGRAVNRDTGAAVAGVRFGSDATSDADGAFRLPASTTSLRAELACYAPLDAALDADASSVLVLMTPIDC